MIGFRVSTRYEQSSELLYRCKYDGVTFMLFTVNMPGEQKSPFNLDMDGSINPTKSILLGYYD